MVYDSMQNIHLKLTFVNQWDVLSNGKWHSNNYSCQLSSPWYLLSNMLRVFHLGK